MKNATATLFLTLILTLLTSAAATAQEGWRGSMTPYNLSVSPSERPDSLKPVAVIHIARHGARYMTSPKDVSKIMKHLDDAAQKGTITTAGREFLSLLDRVDSLSQGHWGMLDSLGYREENVLAEQLHSRLKSLLRRGVSMAWSTNVPRAIMSMYAYMYRIGALSPYLNIETFEGEKQDTLLRYFDTDSTYARYLADGPWRQVYDSYKERTLPIRPAVAMVGTQSGLDDKELRDFTLAAYNVARSLEAMGIDYDCSTFFTNDELMECWKVSNLRHYLQRSANSVSDIAPQAAGPLLRRIVSQLDDMSVGVTRLHSAFYFGHAETLMPLFSLMRLPGCNAPGATAENVWEVWKDWQIIPLGANLDIEIYESPSGRRFVSTILNSQRVTPSDRDELFVPWERVREQWLSYIRK